MHTVQDILEHKGGVIHSIGPDDTVEAALTLMAEHNVGALLVLNEPNEIVGVFSERDFARHALEHRSHIFALRVETFMSRRIRSAPHTMTIETCMALMTEERVRHLPVFRNGELAGVVSIGDVVKAMVHEKDTVIDQLEQYISSSL